MAFSVPFRYLNIGDYFVYKLKKCIKVSDEQLCNSKGITNIGKNVTVVSDPNHKVRGE